MRKDEDDEKRRVNKMRTRKYIRGKREKESEGKIYGKTRKRGKGG